MKKRRLFIGLLLGLFLFVTAVLLTARAQWKARTPATLPLDTGVGYPGNGTVLEGVENRQAFQETGGEPKGSTKEQGSNPGQDRPGVPGSGIREARVIQVVDGDTIIIQGGDPVRIMGVDTPEREEPYYRQARDFQKETVLGKTIHLDVCESEPRDHYGRILAFVHVEGADVGAELLRKGLARTLFIGSCALTRKMLYRANELEAFRAGRGIWSLQKPRLVAHNEAGRYIGRLMTVTGDVKRVHVGSRAIHLNFGPDHRTDFTAVIFRKDLHRLARQGLNLPVNRYKGKRVKVTGILKEYNGPEIIIEFADQIFLYHDP